MPLFQRPAATEEEVARGRPLDLAPDQVAQLDEAAWYARALRGDDVPQLTVRAVLTGGALGFVLASTNLYMGLKTPWMSSVALTACIVAFSLWRVLLRARLARTPLSILETNCMQSTASAAGFSTAAIMVSAIPALLLLSVTPATPRGQHLPWPLLCAWVFFTALLGVMLAVPMKRSMINRERLRFPSGTAAAVTLQSLYSRGEEALLRARALAVAALVAALGPLLQDLRLRGGAGLVPSESPVFDWLPGRGTNPKTGARLAPSDWTIVLDHKLMMIAAGMLVGVRTSASLVAGGLVLAYLVGPAALAAGAAHAPGTAWREIGIWAGAPMLVSASLLWFVLQWRTVVHSFRGLAGGVAAPAGVEVPGSWFATGTVIAGAGIVWIAHTQFAIPWPLGLVALALTFVLCLVACRATGESDITPTGPLGKLVQLTYGVLIPQNATANLMTASITAGASLASADLLTDLKSGYLLGASPRRQFVAQLIGIVPGTIAMVLGFHLLVPDARPLLGAPGAPAQFPAPSAQQWLAVARLFQEGFSTLHPMARHAIMWGLAIGAALTLIEAVTPATVRRFLPSATGLGLGLMLPFQYPLSFLIGAVLAWAWNRRNQTSADRYLVTVSSGLIAGESIVGVVVAAINNLAL